MRARRAGIILVSLLAVMVLGTSARADRGSGEPPPAVKGTVIQRGSRGSVGAADLVSPGVLPLTGAALVVFVAAGSAAIAAGAIVVRRARSHISS